MIEVKSWPPDLVAWSQQPKDERSPFYLEFFGETEPALDQSFAEVVPAKKGTTGQEQIAPVYGYWWTIGHGGVQLRTAGVAPACRSHRPHEVAGAVGGPGTNYCPRLPVLSYLGTAYLLPGRLIWTAATKFPRSGPFPTLHWSLVLVEHLLTVTFVALAIEALLVTRRTEAVDDVCAIVHGEEQLTNW